MSAGIGSSPLTRGKQRQRIEAVLDLGLIPAHAGKTSPIMTRISSTSAHPRSRGENVTYNNPNFFNLGSSPLTRGKHEFNKAIKDLGRLIPAHAGKTTAAATSGAGVRAHPRSRGENQGKPGGPFTAPGSSPLTRGKRLGDAGVDLQARLIPAHAGKTSLPFGAKMKGRAHPRSRGENG